MATPAYRNLLRAARTAFQGDDRVLAAARQQIRSGFRDKAALPPAHPSVAPAVQYANEVAAFLRANVVQGQKEEGRETYSKKITNWGVWLVGWKEKGEKKPKTYEC